MGYFGVALLFQVMMCQNKDLPDEEMVFGPFRVVLFKRLHGAISLFTFENRHCSVVPLMIVTLTISTIVQVFLVQCRFCFSCIIVDVVHMVVWSGSRKWYGILWSHFTVPSYTDVPKQGSAGWNDCYQTILSHLIKRLQGANAILTIENCHYSAVPNMIATTITTSTNVQVFFGAMQILLQLSDLGVENNLKTMH